jgi:hypothetical protein
VSAFIVGILPLLSKLYEMVEDDTFAKIRDDIKALIATLEPHLPAKADGSRWTHDEIHAAAVTVRQPWFQTLAMLGQTR